MRRWALVAGLIVALLSLCGFYLFQVADRVSDARASWVIARVHSFMYGDVAPGDVGCFTLRPGHSKANIFINDPSYTDYESVNCNTEILRDGLDFRLVVTESWDDALPPQGDGPVVWLQRLLYHQAYHSWSFRVHQNGSVVPLPEQGKPAPQTYYH